MLCRRSCFTFYTRCMTQSKVWWKRGKSFRVPIPQNRGSGITLFGAISHCLQNKGYFEVHHSTNGDSVINFMTNIQAHILPEYRHKRLILCIDNHSAHKGPTKIEVMEQFCEPHFIPVYSCELNGPIETAWAVIKRRVVPKIMELQLKKQGGREACVALLKKELSEIEPEVFGNLLRSHYCYLT